MDGLYKYKYILVQIVWWDFAWKLEKALNGEEEMKGIYRRSIWKLPKSADI